MKVLVIEDEADKVDKIKSVVSEYFEGIAVEFDEFSTYGKAVGRIHSSDYDLILTDLYLPRREGDEPTDCSEDLLEAFVESEQNTKTIIVAISRISDLIESAQGKFSRAGIFLLPYLDTDHWVSCLKVCMQRVNFSVAKDFLIFTALEKERAAFRKVEFDYFKYGEQQNYFGLDCREIELGPFKGMCIVQPRMGLVDASVVAARAISLFRPSLAAMAGICGGFAGEVKLGQLVVSDVCWEHQSGKWSANGFELASYQETISNEIRTVLQQMLNDDPKLESLCEDFHSFNVSSESLGVVAPTVSGSAVIASSERQKAIQSQSRKIAALDMEVFGIHRAAALSNPPVGCFAAKTVVDLADEEKDDSVHQYGTILSARFVAKALHELLSCKR